MPRSTSTVIRPQTSVPEAVFQLPFNHVALLGSPGCAIKSIFQAGSPVMVSHACTFGPLSCVITKFLYTDGGELERPALATTPLMPNSVMGLPVLGSSATSPALVVVNSLGVYPPPPGQYSGPRVDGPSASYFQIC